ncbi:MAG: tetratricopeptide repeat protein [Bacteroidota bacterium]|nr:tetratricopeptide repeat protein [Bacteroidota bacterium]
MTVKKPKKEHIHSELAEKPSLFYSFRTQALFLIILGFVFYANTFNHEYALDDGIVIENNKYVQNGFKGIGKILSTDAYASFYEKMNAKQQLSGGRYRPLSIVTFAMEQQLFGEKGKVKPVDDVATVRHVMNVLFYIFSIVLLLYLLRKYVFKDHPAIAFITCLLFLIHPLHTEVIANVKSRDEILSFLFIILTFISVFNYRETKKTAQLICGLLFYFLALLSKEYAVTLLILIPMLLYIVNKDSFPDSLLGALPYFGVAAVYLIIRFSIVGKGATMENPDVLNNPYKFATSPEKWATKIELLNHYLRLLFYPDKMSSDYSYSTIPYTNFGNPKVWAAIFIHLSMVAATVVLFFKRHILAFALAFYLLHLALVSNILMDIGATMGERLVYHSSFGFVIFIAFFAGKLLEKIVQKTTKNAVGFVLGAVVIVWCATVTIARNAEWKNDSTLFIADAATVPNSALVNGNAGKAYIDLSEKPENKAEERSLVLKAIYHLKRSVLVHPEYVNGHLNLGVAYYKLKDYEKAGECWNTAFKIYPNNPFVKRNFELLASVYYNQAMSIGGKDPLKAISLLERSVELDPDNVDYWYNLGGACYTVQDFVKAGNAWTRTLQLQPEHPQAKRGMGALPK